MPHHTIQGQDYHGKLCCRENARPCANALKLDAGMHPAYDGFAAMPFYDEFDLSTVDVLLISQ